MTGKVLALDTDLFQNKYAYHFARYPYLAKNVPGLIVIGALTHTLLLGGDDFPEGHGIQHNDTIVGPGIHGMHTELMLKLDLDRQGQVRNQVSEMRNLVA